jgi:hypothetical protein
MATVDQLQDDAQTYADAVGTKIDALVNGLTSLSAIELQPESVAWAGYVGYDGISAAIHDFIAQKPVDVTITDPSAVAPVLPAIQTITQPADIAVPEFSNAAPLVTIPAAPAFTPPTEPGGAPTLNDPTIPTAPDYTLPAVPTFQTLLVPAAPAVLLPTFSAIAPSTALSAPTNTFAFAETPYASDLLDSLGDKLLSDLEAGGYGIDTADEAQLLDRAMERESETASRAIDEAARTYAARRFDLPPGALLETIAGANQAYQEQANTLSREIALKRYDQLVAARQFAIQQGVALENLRMTFHGAMMERFLNAARYTADAAVAYFNAQVEAAKLQQAQYETAARVYEILVRGKVEELNVYRAQLEAEKMKGDIDRIKIEQYRAQVDAVKTVAEIFNLRLHAAEIQQGMSRLKLEAYRTEIEAYVAKIHGKEIQLRAYEAQIRGEEAKARVFETQARAYDSTVRGKEVAANIARLKVTSQTETARTQIETFNAQVLQYRTLFDGQLGTARLRLDKFGRDYDGYAARAQAVVAMARLAQDAYNGNKEDFLGVLRHNLEKARYLFTLNESNRNWKGDVAAKALSFYTPLASAALSAINTLGVQTSES